MKKVIAITIAALAMTACTTPMTMMKNPQTGQIAQCGGNISSSIAGGIIGYHMQVANDSECIANYATQGFSKI